jgi:chromate transporter
MAIVAAQLPTTSALASVIDWPQLLQIALFFAEAGAFVFGSGLAIAAAAVAGLIVFPLVKS